MLVHSRLFSAVAGLIVLFLPPAAAGGDERADDARPNVVVVLTDDQGFGDVGVHGNRHIRTPHMDRFAREGVRLNRFSVSPVCAPTRAALLTGRYYYRTGVIHTSRGGAKMHGDETTAAELLAQAGYRTGIFGKWHLGDNYPMRPQDQGFQEVLVHKSGGIGQAPDQPNSYFDPILWHNGRRVQKAGYCTDVFFEAALEFIERHRDRPFFVYLPTNAPHTPLEIAPEYSRPYREAGLDDTTARVYGMVTNIDDNFGRLLAKLDELELRRDTVVLFLGDNGPQQNRYNAGLRGRKGSTYEGGLRVPAFAQWPGRFPGGRTLETIAADIDVLPTLLELCRIEPPHDLALDGKSLVPLLDAADANTPADWPDRRLFFQCHRGLEPKRYQNCAVVTQRYKLIGGPGTFSREDFDAADRPVFELYDLAADPGEQRNLAETRPAVVNELRQAYDAWFDDVQSTREFTPGVIRVGTPHENPLRLCRYQDATFHEGRPRGWSVEVVGGGNYDLTIERGEQTGRGRLFVSWQGETFSQPLEKDAHSARIVLQPRRGTLDIWVQEDGRERVYFTENDPRGDVTLHWRD